MRNVLFVLAIVCMAFPAYAKRTTSTIDALDDLVAIATVTRDKTPHGKYEGDIVFSSGFNGTTQHLMVSVDDGATVAPVMDLTDVAYTKTSTGTVSFNWGWPTLDSQSAIFFISSAGGTSAPAITVTVDDNR